MNWPVVILLILFGLIALVLEVLVIPGGVVGILGILSIVGGVVVSYLSYGTLAGNITLATTFLIVVVSLVLSIRSRTWRRLMLSTQVDGKMNIFDSEKIFVGAVGVTLSRLAPSGKAVFAGETVEVTSNHDFIDENSEIVIVKIDGNKIIVKQNL